MTSSPIYLLQECFSNFLIFCYYAVSMCTATPNAKKTGPKEVIKSILHIRLINCAFMYEAGITIMIKNYLPCWLICSIAAWTSSTISTVQAGELYSLWNVWVPGISSSCKALTLGPPNKSTPATLVHKFGPLKNPIEFHDKAYLLI